jgi:hypothetical protein
MPISITNPPNQTDSVGGDGLEAGGRGVRAVGYHERYMAGTSVQGGSPGSLFQAVTRCGSLCGSLTLR